MVGFICYDVRKFDEFRDFLLEFLLIIKKDLVSSGFSPGFFGSIVSLMIGDNWLLATIYLEEMPEEAA